LASQLKAGLILAVTVSGVNLFNANLCPVLLSLSSVFEERLQRKKVGLSVVTQVRRNRLEVSETGHPADNNGLLPQIQRA